MIALEVVGMDVLPDRSSGLLDVVPFCQAGFLILERAEPPLDLDVVSPAALAVHTLTYLVSLQKIFVALAGEPAALIRIRDLRFCRQESFLTCFDTRGGVQCIIQIPANDAAAIPVNDSCQVQEAVLQRDVGYINRPGRVISALRSRYGTTAARCRHFERFGFG